MKEKILGILKAIGSFFAKLGVIIYCLIAKNKIVSGAVALILVFTIFISSVAFKKLHIEQAVVSNIQSTVSEISSDVNSESSSDVSSAEASSETSSKASSQISSSASSQNSSVISSAPVSSAASSSEVSSAAPAVSSAPAVQNQNTEYKYNSNLDIEDNVFLDSMVYTGYNIEKHRADGNMWVYILASQKRGLGYLSNIGYAGGASGYETVNGKPDIEAFERGGMVCASYVTYVYFNYLPNVAGIDTSSLPKPADPRSAHEWYLAAKQWISLGYSKSIPFTATKTPSNYIKFNSDSQISIGSLVIFRDAKKTGDRGSHVAVYAGYKNGYNWIYHVGNENGPEFCAIERVLFGPDPQWPIMVITPPSNIRMSALINVTATDDSGLPVAGVEVTAKNNKTGKSVSLGATDVKGVAQKEGFNYGEYTITYTVPAGYTSSATTVSANLTTKNNSVNDIKITIIKDKPVSSALQSTQAPVTENSSNNVTSSLSNAPAVTSIS